MMPNDKSVGKDIAGRYTGGCSLMRLHVEGSPVVLAEAAARGLSVISLDCPKGTKEIGHRVNGRPD
ncbi:hypothetical protein [Kyrpidia sp.]|uniref:hypothetical protein n=1 Tax=Kyrpidia sp. TaxID=2073077 RepID=UPI00258E20A2|nr:hypothetical protein [Kyrpidia sp.]MCL6576906.1 hypothetical protein [Kyrpidia sp.]